MDFLNHGRELLRQSLTDAIGNHIPAGLRTPIALALILQGSCYAIAPDLFQRRIWGGRVKSRFLSPEGYTLYMRCTGVLMLIAGGVLLEFG